MKPNISEALGWAMLSVNHWASRKLNFKSNGTVSDLSGSCASAGSKPSNTQLPKGRWMKNAFV
eukprot:13473828-Alexandrium_andersonii.AAC.1